MVRRWPFMMHDDIRGQVDAWAAEVVKLEDLMIRKRKHAWDEWVKRAFDENSASRVYRFIKGPVQAAALVEYGPELSFAATSPQELIELKASPWKELWLPDGAAFQAFDHVPFEERALPGPLPSPEEFRGLIRSYRWSTAIGSDHWAPRTMGLLTDQLVKDLLDLCGVMVLHGIVPSQFSLLLVVLIPKMEGGERPIGIFPTILRLLDRW